MLRGDRAAPPCRRGCASRSIIEGNEKMKTTIAVAMGMLALFAMTPAQALTGTQLYEWCRDEHGALADLLCMTYVRGYVDEVTMGTVLGRHHGGQYCPPKQGTVDQARLVEKYFRDHPEVMHNEAVLIMGRAFLEAFLCPPLPTPRGGG